MNTVARSLVPSGGDRLFLVLSLRGESLEKAVVKYLLQLHSGTSGLLSTSVLTSWHLSPGSSFIPIVLLLQVSKCVTVWGGQQIVYLSKIHKLEARVAIFLCLPHSLLSCFLQTSLETAVQAVCPLVFSSSWGGGKQGALMGTG